MKNKWIQEYFTFTKKERSAVLVLVMLIVLISVLPVIIPAPQTVQDQSVLKEFQQQVALLKPTAADSFNTSRYERPGSSYRTNKYANAFIRSPVLFYFDPNTLSQESWRKLGLEDRTIQTIMHYVAKGGRFRKPEDIGKIYSLKQREIDRLLPYVRLSASAHESAYLPKDAAGQRTYSHVPYKSPYADLSIDLNHTDTATLELLPGIGSRLAARIISFRDKLGGFYSADQVAEIYGLPDSTFQVIRPHLKVSVQELTTININMAGADQLKQHPYIRWNISNAIVQYRGQHGNFKTKDELLQIALVTPELYKKLEPYVTID